MIPQFYKANKGCLLNLDQADCVILKDLEAYSKNTLDRHAVVVCFDRGRKGSTLEKFNFGRLEECKVGTKEECREFYNNFSLLMERRFGKDYDKFYRPKERQTMKNHMIKASANVLLNLYNVLSIKVEEVKSNYAVHAYLTEQKDPELLHSGTLEQCQSFLAGAYEGIKQREEDQLQGLRGPAGLNGA